MTDVKGLVAEAGWLIEEMWISPLGGGTLYIHKDFKADKWQNEMDRVRDIHRRRQPFLTKQSLDAMRFETERDALVWLTQQPRFIREGDQYCAREHMWPETPALETLSQQRGCPEGWVLVPREPTDEMIDAGEEAYVDAVWPSACSPYALKEAFAAMISASPPTPTSTEKQDE